MLSSFFFLAETTGDVADAGKAIALALGIGLGALEAVASGVLDPLLGGGTRELVVALVLILTIMIRPHGLFGRHDIERL